jgi:hypothetical protein
VGEAQVALNRNSRYLFAADPGDARSLWVNPAVLGLAHSFSVYADVTLGLDAPYTEGSPLSQVSLGLNSRFLAFGYQFDRIPSPVAASIVRTHTYRFVLWGENGRLGAGGAATLYRGGDGGNAFEAGVAYRMTDMLDLGAVLANIGQPSVRGTDLRLTLRPAATVHAGRLVALQAQTEVADGVQAYAFGARLSLGNRLQLSARLDTDGDFRRQAFSLGISLGGNDRGVAVSTLSGNLKDWEAVSLHAISERSSRAGRRR